MSADLHRCLWLWPWPTPTLCSPSSCSSVSGRADPRVHLRRRRLRHHPGACMPSTPGLPTLWARISIWKGAPLMIAGIALVYFVGYMGQPHLVIKTLWPFLRMRSPSVYWWHLRFFLSFGVYILWYGRPRDLPRRRCPARRQRGVYHGRAGPDQAVPHHGRFPAGLCLLLRVDRHALRRWSSAPARAATCITVLSTPRPTRSRSCG